MSGLPAGAVPAEVDIVVIGAGPAGRSAALNLARSRHSVLVFDANRRRSAATLQSHGFLTRGGISPLELRKLGLAELREYPGTSFHRARVESLVAVAGGFEVTVPGIGPVLARILVLASWLVEILPALPSIRHLYGTSLHSCLVCDGYEKRDQALALVGETDDLAERALLVSRWSRDVAVFTNGIGRVTEEQEARLADRGIRIVRRAVPDVVGDRSGLTGIALEDGEVVPRNVGFIRPRYLSTIDYAESLSLRRDADGYVEVDAYGRTSVPWVYAAGDLTPPGPKQLIIAAGAGAMVAGGINRDEMLNLPPGPHRIR